MAALISCGGTTPRPRCCCNSLLLLLLYRLHSAMGGRVPRGDASGHGGRCRQGLLLQQRLAPLMLLHKTSASLLPRCSTDCRQGCECSCGGLLLLLLLLQLRLRVEGQLGGEGGGGAPRRRPALLLLRAERLWSAPPGVMVLQGRPMCRTLRCRRRRLRLLPGRPLLLRQELRRLQV